VAINPKTIIRVIIEGEWIWVERGTFSVMPQVFVDDDGRPLNSESDAPLAYFFTSTQGDPYFGPMASISLMKLDNQLLEETGSGPGGRVRPAELGEGTGETFGGEVGARRSQAAAAEGPAETAPAAPAAKKAVPLFADDDEDEQEEAQPARRGGLF
jgi:hypothetical protein